MVPHADVFCLPMKDWIFGNRNCGINIAKQSCWTALLMLQTFQNTSQLKNLTSCVRSSNVLCFGCRKSNNWTPWNCSTSTTKNIAWRAFVVINTSTEIVISVANKIHCNICLIENTIVNGSFDINQNYFCSLPILRMIRSFWTREVVCPWTLSSYTAELLRGFR